MHDPTAGDPNEVQRIATLRAEDVLEGVFACTRKERQISRAGTPYLTVELRDSTGTIRARAFRDADLLAGTFDRGDLVRVRGRVERFRDELQVALSHIARAQGADADPASFLPVAYRDLDELDGFLEHLACEVYDPGSGDCCRRSSTTPPCASRSGARLAASPLPRARRVRA